MRTYWLKDRQRGKETLVDGDTVARGIGVEISYVDWNIEVGGVFENEGWLVRWESKFRPIADIGSHCDEQPLRANCSNLYRSKPTLYVCFPPKVTVR